MKAIRKWSKVAALCLLLAVVLFVAVPTAWSAFTKPASSMQWNSIVMMEDGGDLDTWMTEAETKINNLISGSQEITTLTLTEGATVAQPADNIVEITEKSDTLGFIFDSNDIELGAGGTGVATIDFNDIDRLEDVEYISGDNGVKVDLSLNERIEFKDGAETIGLILNGTNTIELATDSGVTTVDFNDVDNLEDVESITGDGTGAISGFLMSTAEIVEANDTLTTANDPSGKIFYVTNDTDGIVLTLPSVGAAEDGWYYTFIDANDAAGSDVTIEPADSDSINGTADGFSSDGNDELPCSVTIMYIHSVTDWAVIRLDELGDGTAAWDCDS